MNIRDLNRDFFSSLASTSPSSVHSACIDDDDNIFSDALFPDCDHLHFVDKLSDAKFPVYLISCSKTDTLYAIKLFYWENDEPSRYYNQELRFAEFAHSNIIKIIDHKEEQELFDTDLDSIKVSYILMEYAKHGDFFNALITRRIPFDEVMVRTYFRQLIEGMEALHSKEAAHLDLKLENLLIGDDFTLKITDFDLSYMSEDGQVVTKGTKNYRAPEIIEGSCTDPYAADIYSAGVILYLLKTGGKIAFTEADGLASLKERNPALFWKKM